MGLSPFLVTCLFGDEAEMLVYLQTQSHRPKDFISTPRNNEAIEFLTLIISRTDSSLIQATTLLF